MTPGNYTIRAYRNDTLQLTFTITDGSNVPISLANATMKMEVRNKPDGDVYLTLTEGDGLTVSGVNNNVVSVSKLVNISDGCTFYYDLQATFTSGAVTTYLKGPFVVMEDITL